MKKDDTTVVSFRVPKQIVPQIDKHAWKAKKTRAGFIESLFVTALETYIGKPLVKDKVAAAR